MEYLKMNELFELVNEEEGVHVSIYMPLEKEPDKADVNRIRLKNLLKEGKTKMSEMENFPADISRPDVEKFFQPAAEFSESLIWREIEGRGLALFLGATGQYVYPSPIPVEEAVYIEPRHNIRPLLPLMTQNNDFYLLTLSQEKVQLWQGNQIDLQKIEVPQLPAGMEEALALEDPERSLQSHVSTGKVSDVQRGERAAIHHGHEAEKEKKGAILRYFRAVDEALMQGLADENAPLIIAAVDYLVPIYREANAYPHLLDQAVTGNPDHLDPKELHEKAWKTTEPYFAQMRKAALDKFREIKGTKIGSQELDEIIRLTRGCETQMISQEKQSGDDRYHQERSLDHRRRRSCARIG